MEDKYHISKVMDRVRLRVRNLNKIKNESALLENMHLKYVGEYKDVLAHIISYKVNIYNGTQHLVYVRNITLRDKENPSVINTDYVRIYGDYVITITTDLRESMAFNDVIDAMAIADHIEEYGIDVDVLNVIYSKEQ